MRKHNLHISTVFFLMILLTFFCVNANAFMIPDEDDLTKTVDYVRYYMYESEGEKLATVYDFVDYDDLTELNILSEIDGYKVIEIEAISEPGDFPNLEEITIGENVEKISLRAFYGLSHLKKVNLPSSLTYIGVSSFSNCTNLESVNLEKVQHIGREAFFGCINLKNVNLSETLDIIEPYSFSQSGLETITIPSKAALTSKDAEWSGHQFSNCLNLKTVIFEDRADKSENFWIDSAAFMGCENLEEVHLPETDSEITIYGAAFRGCKKLKTFDFSNVSIICDGAFANCVKLTEIIFSEKLKALGCHTFENTGLKNITIPSSTILGCYSSSHEMYDAPTETWYGQFRNCKSLKTVIFEDRATSKFTIPHYAFEGCTDLKKVYLPEDIKITVNPRAFKNCTSLTKVYGSENIVEIGDAAFSYCKSLKEITLGKNLKTVGEKAFLGCSKLARVNLKSTKTAPTFGKKAFSGTADGIKFVADKAIAKKVKTNLKNTATKNAKVYSVSYTKV